MSKAQHTPGPWHIADGHHGEKLGIECKEHTFVALVDHRGIFGMQMANARLIAAAPELLEALEFLLGTSAALHRETDEVGWGSVLQARAAIAKAKGE